MQNPFVYRSRLYPHDYSIGVSVPYLEEPLWWTEQGFKDLVRVSLHPESFKTKEEAEQKIRGELLDFIRQYRSDQVDLIKGW